MTKKFVYSPQAAKDLYKSSFVKKSFLSLGLLLIPYVILLILGVLKRVAGIPSVISDFISLLTTISLTLAFPFFFYSLAWYFSKKNWDKNNYIILQDSQVEYYTKEKIKWTGPPFNFLYVIENISRVSEEKEYVLIEGKVTKWRLDYDKKVMFSSTNSIKIARAFGDMRNLTALLKSKVNP